MAPPIDVSKFEQLKASGDLPSPKGVALAVMRLTQQEDVSMAQLGNVIRTDPAFVGRLIKAANGLIGYGRRPVASVQEALTVLGLPAVRNMALGFSLLTHYRAGACEGFDYSRYWAASLLCAVAMQAITLRTRAAAADETYCLGLLARVGELAMATLYPHDYTRIIREAPGDDAVRTQALEMQYFAMNHAELGAAMLADWGLPRVFTDAAYSVAARATNGHTEGSREFLITHSLAVARLMSEYSLVDETERPLLKRHLLLAASHLSLDEETMTGLCNSVAQEWLEWGSLLNIHAEKLPPFESTPLPATEREAAAAVPSAEAAAPAIEMRALVVDAQSDVRSAVSAMLKSAGFVVAEAADGYSAAEKTLDFLPDMLLVGADLPDITVCELIAMLRKTRMGRALYIVTLSDAPEGEASIAALEAGADDVLPKPVNVRVLLAKVGASKRLTGLHREIAQDREEIRHFAAELAVSNRRLKEAALTDSLTGFPNRRCFSERFAQEWQLSSRNKRPLSCFLVDVDRFKAVNDTYGHDAGDAVLMQVAAAIKASVRSNDVVARLGGDEFVVLCPDTAIEAAIACAERVRRAVVEATVSFATLSLSVGVSCGVGCRDATMPDSDALIKCADEGLYLAKQLGRNQVASRQLHRVQSNTDRPAVGL